MTASVLSGIRVIDASQHMAGPMCAQKLGDMGADVIKIEPPGTGEWSRSRAIHGLWLDDLNTSLVALNRNKRGMTLNLKDERGLEILYRLVRDADVFIENMRPQVVKRLKIDYESLAAVNPRLVYCSVTGYGESGPGANRPGQDLLVQAFSGLMYNAGNKCEPPIPAGVFVCDAATGSNGVIGILGALFHRERTGRGQKVEVNLLSSVLDFQTQEFTTYLNTGFIAERTEERLGHAWANPPYGVYKTADGYIALMGGSFNALADALETEELRIGDWTAGYARQDEIVRTVACRLTEKTTAEWVEIFDHHRIWSGPVNTYREVAEDPQVMANGLIQEFEDPVKGRIRYTGFPIQFSGTPATITRNPPLLGEHTDEILTSLGIGADEVDQLRKEAVV